LADIRHYILIQVKVFGSDLQSLHPEDVWGLELRNVTILPQHHTASQPEIPRSSCLN